MHIGTRNGIRNKPVKKSWIADTVSHGIRKKRLRYGKEITHFSLNYNWYLNALTMATPKIRKITITMFRIEKVMKIAGMVSILDSVAKYMPNISHSTDPTASSQAAIVSPVSRRKQQNLACMLSLSIVVASTLFLLYEIIKIHSVSLANNFKRRLRQRY